MVVLFWSVARGHVTPSGGPVGRRYFGVSGLAVVIALQADFFFPFDLYDLAVVDGDFYRAKTQIAQGGLDFLQDAGFIAAIDFLKSCAHFALLLAVAVRRVSGMGQILIRLYYF